MILYRIVRKSDGKVFQTGSCYPYIDGPAFTTTGAFFKTPEAIERHLDQLCYDWTFNPAYQGQCGISWTIKKYPIPDISRLDNYIVEKLTVLASKSDRSDAIDFMGMVQKGYDRARIRA